MSWIQFGKRIIGFSKNFFYVRPWNEFKSTLSVFAYNGRHYSVMYDVSYESWAIIL